MGEQDRWKEGTLNCTNERQRERERQRQREREGSEGRQAASSVDQTRLCCPKLKTHLHYDVKATLPDGPKDFNPHPTPISFVKPRLKHINTQHKMFLLK